MKLNSGDGVPIYLQIIDLVKRQILSGHYRPGERLPSVRELAMELRVNPNTVAKAYTLMQKDSVIEARQGGGNYVSQSESEAKSLSRELVESEIGKAVDTARRLHFRPAEIREIFESFMNDTDNRKERNDGNE